VNAKIKKLVSVRLFLSKFGLKYINVEKCKIKIKKISPTPRSITHKKPINISASSTKR
jgi:hypothetical protein